MTQKPIYHLIANTGKELTNLKKKFKLLKQIKKIHQEETKEIKTLNAHANSKNKFQAS